MSFAINVFDAEFLRTTSVTAVANRFSTSQIKLSCNEPDYVMKRSDGALVTSDTITCKWGSPLEWDKSLDYTLPCFCESPK